MINSNFKFSLGYWQAICCSIVMILINSPKNEFVSVLNYHCGRHGAEAAAIFNNAAQIRNHTLDYQNRRTDSMRRRVRQADQPGICHAELRLMAVRALLQRSPRTQLARMKNK